MLLADSVGGGGCSPPLFAGVGVALLKLPCPCNVTDWVCKGTVAALSLKTSDPVCGPAAVGLYVSPTTHELSGTTVIPEQPSLAMAKGPLIVEVPITSGICELLVTFTLSVELVPPTATVPKLILDGAICGTVGCCPGAAGVGAGVPKIPDPRNSTACGLMRLPVASSPKVSAPTCTPVLDGVN